jgi:hypothetical protein
VGQEGLPASQGHRQPLRRRPSTSASASSTPRSGYRPRASSWKEGPDKVQTCAPSSATPPQEYKGSQALHEGSLLRRVGGAVPPPRRQGSGLDPAQHQHEGGPHWFLKHKRRPCPRRHVRPVQHARPLRQGARARASSPRVPSARTRQVIERMLGEGTIKPKQVAEIQASQGELDKGGLPMPGASAHHHVVPRSVARSAPRPRGAAGTAWPPTKIKTQHSDGTSGWHQATPARSWPRTVTASAAASRSRRLQPRAQREVAACSSSTLTSERAPGHPRPRRPRRRGDGARSRRPDGETRARSLELANEKLHSRRGMFIDALSHFQVDENTWVVNLDKSARWIDDGMPEHNMLENRCSRARRRRSRQGRHHYVVVPFQHNRPSRT